jgi:hypothetical protein
MMQYSIHSVVYINIQAGGNFKEADLLHPHTFTVHAPMCPKLRRELSERSLFYHCM